MDIFYLDIDLFINSGIIQGKTKYEKEHNAGLYIIEYASKNFFNILNNEIEIVNKKPRFKYSDMHFSISHSHNIAAVCFDKNDTGFDIEFIKNRNWQKISERMNFNLQKNSIEEFYKCWTRYEAEFKLQKKAKNTLTLIKGNYAISIASENELEIKPEFYYIKNVHKHYV